MIGRLAFFFLFITLSVNLSAIGIASAAGSIRITYSNRGLYIGNTSTNKYHCRPRLGGGVVMVPAATLTIFTIDDDGDDGKSPVLSGGGRDARSLFCPHMRMPSFILLLL